MLNFTIEYNVTSMNEHLNVRTFVYVLHKSPWFQSMARSILLL